MKGNKLKQGIRKSVAYGIIFCMVIVFVLSSVQVQKVYGETSGSWETEAKEPFSQGDMYKIRTPEELAWVLKQVKDGNTFDGKTIEMENDIDLASRYSFNTGNNTDFEGIFNGNNHALNNIIIGSPANPISKLDNYADSIVGGLFAMVGDNGIVQNLDIFVNINAEESSHVGGIVGLNAGTVKNCGITGSVTRIGTVSGFLDHTGGIVGYNSGLVQDCYSNANVMGSSGSATVVGGIAGGNRDRIQNCYVTGNLDSPKVGGIVGDLVAGSVENCYAYVNMIVQNGFSGMGGGIVGYRYPAGAGSIQNCYYNLVTYTSAHSMTKNNYGTSMEANEMKVQGFVTTLNANRSNECESWRILSGVNEDLPVLKQSQSPLSITGVEDQYTDPSATITPGVNGGSGSGDVTYFYYGRNATIYGPSITAPTANGNYTVTATKAEDDTYRYATASRDFTTAVINKTLISITPPSAITGVANGTVKTALALGFPTSVVLVTDQGDVTANVSWDVDASSYDVSRTTEQTFNVTGTVILPLGVVNPTSVDLITTISVTVNSAMGSGGDSGSSGFGGSGGSSGGSRGSTTTVTGDVIDGYTGQTVRGIEAQVTIGRDGKKIIEINSKRALVFQQPNGAQSSVGDLSKIGFSSATNPDSEITLAADGTLQIKNLANGTDSLFTLTYDLGNGQKIKIGTIEAKVGRDGKVRISLALIDPYGIITDPTTGQPIVGADVTLYYANTERNKNSGKTPNTVVKLPFLDGFRPNNNKNPQVSDESGAYGFMVFPTSDYYIVSTKEGYEAYRSPTISVEQEIVKWDFKMNPFIIGIKRLAGLTSVETALEIAKANYVTKLNNVVLATGENYPDALAGSVLAYKLNAPILLVGSTEVDQDKIISYLKSNLDGTGTVYILGGTAVVSSDMEAKVIASGFNRIIRLGGKDRYETALKIADQLGVNTGTPIVLVYGENYPDALSISGIAAGMQSPILLVEKERISKAVEQRIAEIKPTKVFIIGGEGVISRAVEDKAAQITLLDKTNIVRICGEDRYETSLAVAQYFNLAGQSVCIATGSNYPDALAGSVYAANFNAPIILADGSLSDQTLNFLKARKQTGATLFGGEAVISKMIKQQLEEVIGWPYRY